MEEYEDLGQFYSTFVLSLQPKRPRPSPKKSQKKATAYIHHPKQTQQYKGNETETIITIITIITIMPSLLRAALPFAALAHAASDVVFNPDSNPPLNLSPVVFREAAAVPNATNAVPLAFGDSSDDTGANQWGLRILVTGNVPVRDDDDNDDDDDDDDEDVTQLTVISLIAPEGLSSDATREAQDDRGSCEVFSSQCRDALESAASNRDGCGRVDIPDSCSEWFSSDRQWNDEVTSNATLSSRVFARATDPEDAGSDDARAAYARAVTHVWPVVVSLGDSSALRCLRASDVHQGSDEPDRVPDRDPDADGDSDDDDDDDDDRNGNGSGSGSGSGSGNDDDDDNAAGMVRAGVFGAVGVAVLAAVAAF
ncbi:hypothetical protein SODALDRAFT_376489 [Sodiomyces alkalinus F11]|uniref:Uncharacterized protein n=1 Tax=Sodiomyces alkalinus (strain CBS 110278 / VKM F-3762 / F11) TaxID=1314773 RepID=A0A3N2Q1V1_SODAK|nr:hypothetical protein SODALDRAFT_376489 [Sodiomyces alkalinus F11]ROT40730.1 hypothetical protein SODALDRAFT_376489 [Sodiomyces alkalinus F11]